MKSIQNILIIGGSGFVGATLVQELAPQFKVFSVHQHEFTPFDGVTYLKQKNIADKNDCKRIVDSVEPDLVIYCAGSHDVQYTEQNPKVVQVVHTTGMGHYLTASEKYKAKFVYLSSDFIFSGSDGNYSESDSAIPITQYGTIKIGSENFLKSRSLNHMIIRCAPLLGRGPLEHPSWLDRLRTNLALEKEFSVEAKTYHNPIHISALVKLIKKIIETDVKNKTLHLGGLTKVTDYELATIFATQFKLDASKIQIVEDPQQGNMNLDYSLNFTQTMRQFKLEPLLLEQSLELLK